MMYNNNINYKFVAKREIVRTEHEADGYMCKDGESNGSDNDGKCVVAVVGMIMIFIVVAVVVNVYTAVADDNDDADAAAAAAAVADDDVIGGDNFTKHRVGLCM
jgi:hypothetical protein